MKKVRKTHVKRSNADREALAVGALESLLANGVPRNSAIVFVMANHPVPYRLMADHLGLTQARVAQICKKTPCNHKTEQSLIDHYKRIAEIAERMGAR